MFNHFLRTNVDVSYSKNTTTDDIPFLTENSKNLVMINQDNLEKFDLPQKSCKEEYGILFPTLNAYEKTQISSLEVLRVIETNSIWIFVLSQGTNELPTEVEIDGSTHKAADFVKITDWLGDQDTENTPNLRGVYLKRDTECIISATSDDIKCLAEKATKAKTCTEFLTSRNRACKNKTTIGTKCWRHRNKT